MPDIGVTIFFLELGILSILAHVFGEMARRIRVPSVVGELSVGVILGPTLLKKLAPGFQTLIFPSQGDAHSALAAVLNVGLVFFLLAAGLEVDLRLVRRSGRLSVPISLAGVAVPFMIAFLPVYFYPEIIGLHAGSNRVVQAMFMGACCSITALPLLGRILFDTGLYKTGFGMLIMSSAVLDDFIGWILIGVVLALNEGRATDGLAVQKIELMIVETLVFVVVLLTAGRWFCNLILSLSSKLSTDNSRVICLVMAMGLLGASATAAIGIHGLLGAFIVGVVLGSSALSGEKRQSIEKFVNSFFAPAYFAAVGLSVNFVDNFAWQIVAFVFVIACLGKVAGCFLAAKVQKISTPLSLAIGVAMNSRGGAEIVLATIGVQAGIIDEHIFVALALMAVATCSISGWSLRAMAQRIRDDKSLELQVAG